MGEVRGKRRRGREASVPGNVRSPWTLKLIMLGEETVCLDVVVVIVGTHVLDGAVVGCGWGGY